MNNENKFLFKLPEYKEAQRKYNLYPCQLAVLLKLVEHPPKDENYHTIVGANCKLSNFTFEWCKDLICNHNSIDAYADGLKQGCLKCPYNNYNYCDYTLILSIDSKELLHCSDFKCTVCDTLVPYHVAMTSDYCPNCGRKIRNKDLL